MVLTDIYVYPIKSLGGIRLAEAQVETRGLRYDRRWLLIDEQNQFLTQRTDARLALLDVGLTATALTVWHRGRPDLPPLRVALTEPATAALTVRIWDDECPALPVDAAADAWFTAALARPTRLVYMPDTTHRPVDPAYAPAGAVVSFADAYPFLVIGQAALDSLNDRLRAKGEPPVPMDRFRPNFVFREGPPHAEDTWDLLRIGDVSFRAVKPCTRCVMTTIDQRTAQAGKEPLRTLARYRARGSKVLFGQNLLGLMTGTVRVGDVIRVDE